MFDVVDLNLVSFVKVLDHGVDAGRYLLEFLCLCDGEMMMAVGNVESFEVGVTGPIFEVLVYKVAVVFVSGKMVIKVNDEVFRGYSLLSGDVGVRA